jgi:alpha,alpha-trehalase
MVDEEYAQKIVDNLHRLEADYGLFACEKNDIPGAMRWNYPYGCGCIEFIAVKALDNYGYKDIAKRLAIKHVYLVEKVFDETGSLWEKYNVVEGNINVIRRTTMPSMMGKSAGSYLMLKKYAEEGSF